MRSCQPVAPGTGVRKAGGKEGTGCSERHLAAQVSALPFLPESFSCGPDLTAGGRAIAVLTSHLSDLALKRSLALITLHDIRSSTVPGSCSALSWSIFLSTYLPGSPSSPQAPRLGLLASIVLAEVSGIIQGSGSSKTNKTQRIAQTRALRVTFIRQVLWVPADCQALPGTGIQRVILVSQHLPRASHGPHSSTCISGLGIPLR